MALTLTWKRWPAQSNSLLAVLPVLVVLAMTMSVGFAWVPSTTTATVAARLYASTNTHSDSDNHHCHPSRDSSSFTSNRISQDLEQSNHSVENSSFSRRTLLTIIAATPPLLLLLLVSPPTALAADDTEIVYYNAQDVQQAFDAIRFELQDSKGGVAFMQDCIDRNDFAALLEFTKGYDLEFRKAKLLQTKKKFKIATGSKGDPIQLLNNITFDLIGMNKACRQGQENMDVAQTYLNELKDDIAKFVALQSTIPIA